jgi:hypothetical protein
MYQAVMFSSLRSSEAKYMSLDGSNSETHYLYRHVANSICLFWREAIIFFLAIACAILALGHTYYPLDNPGDRAKVPEYRELQSMSYKFQQTN